MSDLVKDSKNTCPNCGTPGLSRATITDKDNISISGNHCKACEWSG